MVNNMNLNDVKNGITALKGGILFLLETMAALLLDVVVITLPIIAPVPNMYFVLIAAQEHLEMGPYAWALALTVEFAGAGAVKTLQQLKAWNIAYDNPHHSLKPIYRKIGRADEGQAWRLMFGYVLLSLLMVVGLKIWPDGLSWLALVLMSPLAAVGIFVGVVYMEHRTRLTAFAEALEQKGFTTETSKLKQLVTDWRKKLKTVKGEFDQLTADLGAAQAEKDALGAEIESGREALRVVNAQLTQAQAALAAVSVQKAGAGANPPVQAGASAGGGGLSPVRGQQAASLKSGLTLADVLPQLRVLVAENGFFMRKDVERLLGCKDSKASAQILKAKKAQLVVGNGVSGQYVFVEEKLAADERGRARMEA